MLFYILIGELYCKQSYVWIDGIDRREQNGMILGPLLFFFLKIEWNGMEPGGMDSIPFHSIPQLFFPLSQLGGMGWNEMEPTYYSIHSAPFGHKISKQWDGNFLPFHSIHSISFHSIPPIMKYPNIENSRL